MMHGRMDVKCFVKCSLFLKAVQDTLFVIDMPITLVIIYDVSFPETVLPLFL